MASSADSSLCESLLDDDSESKVKLGFVEDVDCRLISSKFFPSKVGGKPAWLSLDPVPEYDRVKCGCCGGPTVFLMQVYAPLKTDETFHRTLFIFVCFKDSCMTDNGNANFKVLRSQLPLKNTFYSEEPPDEDLDSDEDCSSFPHAKHYQTLCNICGIKSAKKCAKCKKAYYCTREHQTVDWKLKHKCLCDKMAADEDIAKNSDINIRDSDQGQGVLFKEHELVVEEEEEHSESRKNKSEKERMEEYKMMMDALKMKGSVDDSGQYAQEDLDQAATGETDDDKCFLHFRKKVEPEPTQVLRYFRGREPLWISAFHRPALDDIPDCCCGAKRIFEFQVMPQLLNHLKVGSLDWGTLCVYTCAQSCDIGHGYREEFLWKQDFHSAKRN